MHWSAYWVRRLLVVILLAVGCSAPIALAQTDPPPDGAILYLPAVMGPPPARVLIAAAHIDSTVSYEPDEAILLWNVGGSAQPLAGWSVRAGSKEASFPSTSALQLQSGERLWCTAHTNSFRLSFGEEAGCAWSSADNGAELLSAALSLNNNGGVIALLDDRRRVVDVLRYGATLQTTEGWFGPPANVYTRGPATAAGQVWRRKLDPLSGLPIDNDIASDWAGDLADLAWGRRVHQPGWGGWSREDGLWPWSGTESASWMVAVGPEGLYAPMLRFLESASRSLDLSLYTLEHPSLAAALVAAIQRGVRVRLMLDGAPPGGITNLQKWCIRQIAEAGGEVYYMAVADGAPKGYKRRYRYLHAKYGIADESRAFVGTENLTLNAMPEPAESPVGGRRGVYLFTDASGVVAALRTLFDLDWRPTTFADLRPYEAAHPQYGAPPPDFTPPPPPFFPVPEAPFGEPLQVSGVMPFLVVSAPENALRPDVGIQALLHRAGAGDEIVFLQMYEHKFFGDSSSNPIADPNPRLEAAIEAARRGARVRLLLDSFFDDPAALRSNRATVDYVRAVAAAEGLDLDARTGNPTGGGIHAKLVLVRTGGQWWSAVGSLNGGEVSHKLNREVVLMVEHPEIYARLYSVFERDWELSALSTMIVGDARQAGGP